MAIRSTIPCKGDNCTSLFIQNKKHHLCSQCMFKKNHDGKGQAEVYAERKQERDLNKRLDDIDKKFGSGEFKPLKPILKADLQKPIDPKMEQLIDGLSRVDRIKNDSELWRKARKENPNLFRPLRDLLVEKMVPDFFHQTPEEQANERNQANATDEVTEEQEQAFFAKEDKKASKRRKGIKKQSPEQAEIERRYRATCADMDYTTEPVCTGCLRYQGGDIKLSHSHLISRKACKEIGHPELIYDRRNLVYHCLDFGENEGCHRKYENPKRRHELKDFDHNQALIVEMIKEKVNAALHDDFIKMNFI